jgi:sentrin-specific protease 1
MEKGRFSHARVKKWTNKIDVFNIDKVFLPCNLNDSHWVVAVLDNNKKRIEILDSLGGENVSLKQNLLRWLQEEHMARKGNALPSE